MVMVLDFWTNEARRNMVLRIMGVPKIHCLDKICSTP